MSKKIGLVLGSGGARGFCHIGVIEVLRENNIPIDIITGCSMGALIGGGFAAGVSATRMREIASQVTTRTVFDIDIRNIFRGGLAHGSRAMTLFRQYAGDIHIEECNTTFRAIAADLRGQKLHVFSDGPVHEAVRASIAIPGIFHPVEHEGMLLVDGGIMKRMPISEAKELGADIIIAVDAIGAPRPPSSTSTFSILDASYQTIDWRSAQHEGQHADILITPELGTRSSFIFSQSEDAIKIGREAAIAALPSIKKLLEVYG